jgi:phytol kinase
VSGAIATLAGNTWLAMAVALGSFLLLFMALQKYARVAPARPEMTRKMFHTGSGALTLAFPFLFREAWPVLLLTGASALLIAAVKFLPALRDRLGHVTNRVERPTLGELYFPLAVALLFWLTRGQDPLLFVIPVLMLTFADATCALVGGRYGMTRYVGASKSLEGSIAFVVVAFLCVHVPLLLWSNVGRAESLLIAATLALLVMLLEGSAWKGLDNLFIPIGGYFLLRAYMSMDATTLLSRLIVTVALIVLIVIARHRTTLEDDALVAGAFLCYVAWAVMGWQWLIGPLAIALGYRWLSPPTPDNSRRMHDVPAVLSVWAAALGWLALARGTGEPTMLYPYTIVFGAHLAMFGTSRLGFQFPAHPLRWLFWRAVITSWAIVMVPYVVVEGVDTWHLAAALGALAAIALGTGAFVGTQPEIRDAPQTTRRWLYQAAAASIASATAWELGTFTGFVDGVR